MNRTADILHLREQGLTLQQIGNKYGITRERVRQIIKASKKEMTKEELFYACLDKLYKEGKL